MVNFMVCLLYQNHKNEHNHKISETMTSWWCSHTGGAELSLPEGWAWRSLDHWADNQETQLVNGVNSGVGVAA
jgi:hypothetical protein